MDLFQRRRLARCIRFKLPLTKRIGLVVARARPSIVARPSSGLFASSAIDHTAATP